MSASRKSTIDKAKYKAEYKRRYGEDLPDMVYDSPRSKMNRKLAGIKEKIRKKLMKKAEGGSLKPVPQDNKGLKKLPTKVRNKMGYMKSGGRVMKYRKGGMVCPINGMAKRGRTKGTTVVA